jgi:hypothetical protein
MAMKRIFKLAATLVLAAAGGAQAAALLVTSAAALGANDSVNWSQLGPDGTIVAAGFGATSVNSVVVSGGLAGSDACLAVVGGSNCGWNAGPGFTLGDSVLWAEDSGGAGSGPLSLGFSGMLGAGLYLQALASGAFTASIEAFNGGNSLGLFSESSASGDGIFIGVLDSVADITSIRLSLTACTASCDLNDFGVNTLLLKAQDTGTGTVPEPATLPLVLLAGGGLAMLRRRAAGNLAAIEETNT